jgi:apolipoprotein N-acyltransferase
VGFIFEEVGGVFGVLGVYGVGFVVFALAGFTWKRGFVGKAVALGVLSMAANWSTGERGSSHATVNVAGVQLEFPADLEVPKYLDGVLKKYPNAEMVVLSEYTFDGPVPKHVREWCRRNGRYLIAGGKEEVFEDGGRNFRNTAYVVGPKGEIVFQQCKSVPIQFFNDGLAAREQRVWDSPWGKIAIPVCYDLSYRRVTDRFVAAGAEAFIVPFMDVTDWGVVQHRQHARVAPIRAREYGVSIFRVGSSGLSQLVDSRGEVSVEAGFPGQGEMIGGVLEMREAKLPVDHWIAPVCSGAMVIFVLMLLARGMRRHAVKAS